MNPITIFPTIVCAAAGAALGAMGHLYWGILFVIAAIVIASSPMPSMRKIINTVNEPTNKRLKTALETARQGIIAGAAGGLAEIAWVTLYAGATGSDPATLARGITTAAGVNTLFPAAPAALGVVVHMGLAVTLGIALAFLWRTLSSHRPETTSPFPFMVAALAGIWAINFFVVLPILSPAFTHLVPYPASLMSKVLFGLAAAEVFRRLIDPASNLHGARAARRLEPKVPRPASGRNR